MPKKLKSMSGKRATFTAKFKRFIESDDDPDKRSLYLTNVHDQTGTLIVNSVWLNMPEDAQDMEFESGDSLRFQARVMEYDADTAHSSPIGELEASPHIYYSLNDPSHIENLGR